MKQLFVIFFVLSLFLVACSSQEVADEITLTEKEAEDIIEGILQRTDRAFEEFETLGYELMDVRDPVLAEKIEREMYEQLYSLFDEESKTILQEEYDAYISLDASLYTQEEIFELMDVGLVTHEYVYSDLYSLSDLVNSIDRINSLKEEYSLERLAAMEAEINELHPFFKKDDKCYYNMTHAQRLNVGLISIRANPIITDQSACIGEVTLSYPEKPYIIVDDKKILLAQPSETLASFYIVREGSEWKLNITPTLNVIEYLQIIEDARREGTEDEKTWLRAQETLTYLQHIPRKQVNPEEGIRNIHVDWDQIN